MASDIRSPHVTDEQPTTGRHPWLKLVAGVILIFVAAFGVLWLLNQLGPEPAPPVGEHRKFDNPNTVSRFVDDAKQIEVRMNSIANEVDRYTVMPGQALAYKTGQLEILRLRADAQRRLGPAFDIKAFHDTVLGSGAVSLPVLRDLVEDWLATAAKPEGAATP